MCVQPISGFTSYGMCEALKGNGCARPWHSGLSYGPSPERMVKNRWLATRDQPLQWLHTSRSHHPTAVSASKKRFFG
jgi:hypothetical protein